MRCCGRTVLPMSTRTTRLNRLAPRPMPICSLRCSLREPRSSIRTMLCRRSIGIGLARGCCTLARQLGRARFSTHVSPTRTSLGVGTAAGVFACALIADPAVATRHLASMSSFAGQGGEPGRCRSMEPLAVAWQAVIRRLRGKSERRVRGATICWGLGELPGALGLTWVRRRAIGIAMHEAASDSSPRRERWVFRRCERVIATNTVRWCGDDGLRGRDETGGA